jgi:hypothetical protein
MRELVIDRLVNSKHFDIDWSKGFVGAKETLTQAQDTYRWSLLELTDEQLLGMLVDQVAENIRNEAVERGAYYGDL